MVQEGLLVSRVRLVWQVDKAPRADRGRQVPAVREEVQDVLGSLGAQVLQDLRVREGLGESKVLKELLV